MHCFVVYKVRAYLDRYHTDNTDHTDHTDHTVLG